MSRCSAYHGMSRSRKQTLCPRLLSARTRARYVVACPFPHEEVIDRPKITMSNGLLMHSPVPLANSPFGRPITAEAAAHDDDTCAPRSHVVVQLHQSV